MDYKYTVLNQCLQILKQSDMPTIKKLRIELLLIQIKGILLNDDLSYRSRDGSCGVGMFEALLSQLRGICGGNYEGRSLTDLMDRMGGMLTMLDGRA
jgi:hypothetical protein